MMRWNNEIAWAENRREQKARAKHMFWLPGFPQIHPMKLLVILSQCKALHHSVFMEFQHCHKIWVTKMALRALARCGYIVPDNISYVWCATEKGRLAARKYAKAEGEPQ